MFMRVSAFGLERKGRTWEILRREKATGFGMYPDMVVKWQRGLRSDSLCDREDGDNRGTQM